MLNSSIKFIEKAGCLHNNRYDYSIVKYLNSHSKIDIVCPTHGEFSMKPSNHLNGQGCPKCSLSKEQRIEYLLKYLGLEYIQQHTFSGCRNKNPLYFDFFVPKHNTLIEYYEIQHFKPVNFFGGSTYFNQLNRNDSIKNEYCKSNNLKLIRIHYSEYDILEKIIKKSIFND